MKVLPENRQIYITGRLWHEIEPKVNIAPFAYALHEEIDLCCYGDGLQKFYFTFLIVLPGHKMFKPYAEYDKKSKVADICVRIPYEQVQRASEDEMIKLMEEAYLKGIDKLETIKTLENFDVATFKKDVESIFAKENWYKIAEAA